MDFGLLFLVAGVLAVFYSTRVQGVVQIGVQILGIVVGCVGLKNIINMNQVVDQLLINPTIEMKDVAPSDSPRSIFLQAVYFTQGGAIVADKYSAEIDELQKHLIACAISKKVTVRVTGYTSSSKYSSESNNSNRDLAINRLEGEYYGDGFQVISSSWSNSDDLSRSRLINDLVEDAGTNTDMEYLNRVAIISLENAGDCEPDPRGWKRVWSDET